MPLRDRRGWRRGGRRNCIWGIKYKRRGTGREKERERRKKVKLALMQFSCLSYQHTGITGMYPQPYWLTELSLEEY